MNAVIVQKQHDPISQVARVGMPLGKEHEMKSYCEHDVVAAGVDVVGPLDSNEVRLRWSY
jgi:hypothetical protein